jgi:hypothetical protein
VLGGPSSQDEEDDVFAEADAKRFFIAKVTAQASAEGQPLSEDERWMLGFSESDPNFVVDPSRIAAFEREVPPKDYEARVTGLLKRSFERDVAADAQAKSIYQQALAALATGDHYVLVMIEAALPPSAFRPAGTSGAIGLLAGAARFLLLAVPGAIATILAAGLIWSLASRRLSGSGAEAAGTIALLLGLGGPYLLWLWFRERRE